jgi:hypothetical protein
MILIRPIELYRSQPVTTLRWHFRNIYGYWTVRMQCCIRIIIMATW